MTMRTTTAKAKRAPAKRARGPKDAHRLTHGMRLGEIGVDAIAGRIEKGESQWEIAASLDMPVSMLNEWLHKDVERSARTREAMEKSAEGWVDRGLQALLTADPDPVEIQRARYIEQHCARRAAIRNPQRYGEKQTHEHTGGIALKVVSEFPDS